MCVCVCPQEWEEKRRQNIEQMKEEMEKLAEYERGQGVRFTLADAVIKATYNKYICLK